MRTIKIEITEDGEVVIEAVGFAGKSCKAATEAFEKALGLATSTIKKPEFYQTAQTQQKVGG